MYLYAPVQIVLRSLDLCNSELRRNWRSFPHQFLLLLDGVLGLLTSVLSTSDCVRPGIRGELKAHPEGDPPLADFSHASVFNIKSPRVEDLSGNSPALRWQLAQALELDVRVVDRILDAHKYILTVDVRLPQVPVLRVEA